MRKENFQHGSEIIILLLYILELQRRLNSAMAENSCDYVHSEAQSFRFK